MSATINGNGLVTCPNCSYSFKIVNKNSLSLFTKINIMIRDKFTCRVKGCYRNHKNTRLHIHHRKPLHNDGKNIPSNLITVCSYHHRIIHSGGGYEFDRSPRNYKRVLT